MPEAYVLCGPGQFDPGYSSAVVSDPRFSLVSVSIPGIVSVSPGSMGDVTVSVTGIDVPSTCLILAHVTYPEEWHDLVNYPVTGFTSGNPVGAFHRYAIDVQFVYDAISGPDTHWGGQSWAPRIEYPELSPLVWFGSATRDTLHNNIPLNGHAVTIEALAKNIATSGPAVRTFVPIAYPIDQAGTVTGHPEFPSSLNSALVQWEIDWGDGSDIEIYPVHVLETSDTYNTAGNIFLPSDISHTFGEPSGNPVVIRARDGWGRLSPGVALRIRPEASYDTDGNTWDASASYGRTGTLADPDSYQWHFTNEYGDSLSSPTGESTTLNLDSVAADYNAPKAWLTVTDSLGAVHTTPVTAYRTHRRVGLSHDVTGNAIVVVPDGNDVVTYALMAVTLERVELDRFTSATARNAQLDRRWGRLWMMVQFGTVDNSEQTTGFSLRFSDDGGRSWSAAVTPVLELQNRDAAFCILNGGGAVVAVDQRAKFATDLYFRRSAAGTSWGTGTGPYIGGGRVLLGSVTSGARRKLSMWQRSEPDYTQLWVTDGYSRLWYSRDVGRSWVADTISPAIWDSTEYRWPQVVPLLGGGAASVAIKQDTWPPEVWFLRTNDPTTWPEAEGAQRTLVGVLDSDIRGVALEQVAAAGRPTLVVTNGLDRYWRSDNMGRSWNQLDITEVEA